MLLMLLLHIQEQGFRLHNDWNTETKMSIFSALTSDKLAVIV